MTPGPNSPSRAGRAAMLLGMLLGFATVVLGPPRPADGQAAVVVDLIEVRGTIDPPMAALLRQSIEFAAAAGAGAVLLDIDSPGTISVDIALITPIIEQAVPVIAWVGPGASASGGAAFAVVAADVVVLSEHAGLGPAIPFDLSDGAPGQADPARDGLSDYTSLRRTLRLPTAEAADTAAALSTDRFDSGTALARGLVTAVAETPEAALAAVAGTRVTKGASSWTLDLPEGNTLLRRHDPTIAQRLLRHAAVPTATFLLLVALTVAVVGLVWRPGLATLVLGVTGPFAIVGIQVVPAVWWAVTLVVVGLLLVGFDAAVAWLGLPTAIGLAGVTFGGMRLTTGAALLRVAPAVIAGVVVLALVISWLGYRLQVERLLRARALEDEPLTPHAQ